MMESFLRKLLGAKSTNQTRRTSQPHQTLSKRLRVVEQLESRVMFDTDLVHELEVDRFTNTTANSEIVSINREIKHEITFNYDVAVSSINSLDFQNDGIAAYVIDSVVQGNSAKSVIVTSHVLSAGSYRLEFRDDATVRETDPFYATLEQPVDGQSDLATVVLPTGLNIIPRYENGLLTIVGSNLDNNLSFIGTVNSTLQVTGLSVTQNDITTPFTFEIGNVRSLAINTLGGNDTVLFNRWSFENLTINLGTGNDTLFLGPTTTPDITTTAGLDAAVASGTLNVENLSITGSDGNDSVTMNRMFNGYWYIDLGNGNDSLRTYWTSSYSLNISLGADQDVASIGYHAAYNAGTGAARLDGGAGHDLIGVFLSSFTGDVNCFGRNGIDTLAFDANNFGRSVLIDGGNDSDTIVLAASLVAQRATLTGGQGTDSIRVGRRFDNSTGGNVMDRFVLNAGTEDDQVVIGNNRFNSMTVDMGAGDDTLTLADYFALLSTSDLNGNNGVDTLVNNSGLTNLTIRNFEFIT
jgi:hypothetical protein